MTAHGESFVIWKAPMKPISSVSPDLRSSPEGEDSQKPPPVQQFRGKGKGW